jgi:hypothetical protein
MGTMEAGWSFFNVKCGHISARDQKAGEGVAVGEVWHVHHKGNEVKIVCSDTLRWNGYSQDHASGGGGKYSDTTRCNEYRQKHASGDDIVIQPDQGSAVNGTSMPVNMWKGGRVEYWWN